MQGLIRVSNLPPNLTVTKDNTQSFRDAISQLANVRLMVGVPAEKGERKPDPITGIVPEITNAQIAYIQDNGAPEVNIPSREFLRPGVRSIQQEIVKRLFNIGKASFEGRAVAAIKGYMALGLVAVSAVRKKITDGPFVPLAEATLAARRARGVTRTKPLIDTGQLRNSITYVLREHGEDKEVGDGS